MNKREETLTFPADRKVTVASVLKMLSEKYGATFTDYVYDSKSGQPKGFLQFLINGNSTSTMTGLQTELQNGDTLAVLPPVGGG